VTITRLSDSKQIVDFGENLSGFVRLSIPAGRAIPGESIILRHAEVLQHPPYGPRDGNIYNGNLRSALAMDNYTMKGDPQGEVYEPHFTSHGMS
jgi:alpha-L-rhamnosidase